LKALLFSAGRGERMRPLTDTRPKPLLEVGGKPLIEWHLEKLAAFGVREVVINTSWLAEQFPATLGDGRRWDMALHYSYEGPEPRETGGGMHRALPWLGDAPFLAINADIWTDFDFAGLPREPRGLAHLVLVPNPAHHPRGDFRLDNHGQVHDRPADGEAPAPTLTFAGIGVYRPQLMADARVAAVTGTPIPARFPIAPQLRRAMAEDAVDGQRHNGAWADVGTPTRLAELDAAVRILAAD
jgi:MurNAc alpha-1-phosphate uridylyltransferase